MQWPWNVNRRQDEPVPTEPENSMLLWKYWDNKFGRSRYRWHCAYIDDQMTEEEIAIFEEYFMSVDMLESIYVIRSLGGGDRKCWNKKVEANG